METENLNLDFNVNQVSECAEDVFETVTNSNECTNNDYIY